MPHSFTLDDLLEYARAGQGGEIVESVDTAILLEQASELTTFPPRFMFEIEPPMPIFETARVPLQRVFMNLISNAVKHHDRPNGHARVAAQELGSFWSFVVSDDGPGIPPHFIARAFQMFQTVAPGSHTWRTRPSWRPCKLPRSCWGCSATET